MPATEVRFRDVAREGPLWLLAASVLAFFYQPLTTRTFFFRDLYLLFYPKKHFFIESIRNGHLPLWDPLTNGGQPYLVSPANTALHPSNLLYFVLEPLTAFNVILVLHFVLCAVAAYVLARVIGLSRAAAFTAGAVFSLCGYSLSTANLMPALLGLPWIPLTIALTHRALTRNRSLAWPAIAASIPLFSGAAELAAMLFLTLIIWIAFGRYEQIRPRARIAAAAIIIAFAAGLSLIATLPATSMVRQSSRRQRLTYQTFASWSVHPYRFPELVVPRFFGPTDGIRDSGYWGQAFETEGFPYILSIYFGIPALLLAAAGARRRPELAAIAVIAIVLSIGSRLPGFRLLWYLPVVSIFRYPVKAILISILPIALLAGYGVETFRDRRWLGAGIAATSTAIALSLMHSNASLALSFVHAAVAALALTFAARLPSHRAAALAAIVFADLAIAGARVNVYGPRALFDEPPLAAEVKRQIGDGRFWSMKHVIAIAAPANDIYWLARWQMATLNGYAASSFGIPAIYHHDYDGLAPRRIAALSMIIDRLPPQRRQRLLDRGNVRIFSTTTNAKTVLHRNPSAVAARFVSSVDAAGSENAAANHFLAATLDDARVILETPPTPVGNCGTSIVTTQRISTDEVRYQFDAPCAGYVVFADTSYEGWTATLDRHPVPIVNADFAFSAVSVPPGRHEIVRSYRPPLFAAGALGSLLSLLLLVLLPRVEGVRSKVETFVHTQ